MTSDDYLRNNLEYHPDSGVLRATTSRGNRYAGEEVGWLHSDGYRKVELLGRQYMVHRICWFLYYGVWPEQEIDHRDGDRANNRINNLRDVSRATNNKNKGIMRNNTSGITGVAWRSDAGKWAARIRVAGVMKCLGHYASKEEAALARSAAEEQYGFTHRHGT